MIPEQTMIVRETATSLLLITQPDHALLAWRLMEPAAAIAASARRDSILQAIREHDNGWREVDASPAVDPATGRLVDFVSAPAHVRQGVWPRGVARLSADPWAAALVAHHALTVYDRYLGDRGWAPFFAAMTAARDRHIGSSGHTLDELRADYVFVRIGDLASLVFCNAWTDEQGFGGQAVQLEGSRLVIRPDPYDGRTVQFSVTARELARRSYVSEDDARAAFASAPVVTLSGVAEGGRAGS
jgi:hypothetical protein